jgi:conjugal transfer ATP-binding protein TraC
MLNVITRNVRRAFGHFFTEAVAGAHYTPTPIAEPTVNAAFNRFADLLPYACYLGEHKLFGLTHQDEEDDALAFDRAPGISALAFAIELIPQTGAPEDMSSLYETIFQYLPAGSGVTWSLFGSPMIDGHLARFVATRRDPREVEDAQRRELAQLHRAMAERQAAYYASATRESLFSAAPYLLRDIRLVMSVVVPITDVNDARRRDEIVALRETICTTFKTYYQFKKVWDANELINWCALLLNADATFARREAPQLEYDDGRLLRDQIVAPATVARTTAEGMRYGLPQHDDEIVMQALSVRAYPKRCTLGDMGALIGDALQAALNYATPFVVTLGVIVQDFNTQRNVTQMTAARATQKFESPMSRFMPELKDRKDDWDIAQRAFDAGVGSVKLYHQILLYSRPEHAKRAVTAAQAVWRAKRFVIAEDTYMQLQALLVSLPMTLTPALQRDLKVSHRLTTKTVFNAVNMAPLLGEWHGVGEPTIPIFGRRGQVMCLDVFENTAGNYNLAVVGAPGSGKSVLLNLLALSYLGVGGRVWIFDVGRSYEKLCRLLGGQYIQFSVDSDVRINPFHLVRDIDEDLEMLIPLFAQMCSPSQPLDDFCKRNLGMHLQSVWYARGRNATIDDVAHSLINNCELGGPNPLQDDPEWRARVREMSHEERRNYCDVRIRDLGIQLSPFTSGGQYGRYFHGETNVDLSNDFIVLELEELALKSDLRAVMMFLLMYKVTEEMYFSPRSRKKICIIDEAWQLLDGEEAEFIENGYRRARKYEGSFATGTQSFEDYGASKSAEAALACADWVFIMRQKLESVVALEKSGKILVDAHMKEMLFSLKKIDNAYSEVFVHGGQLGCGVGRVVLDPFSLLVASSKPADYTAMERYRAAGYSLTAAVEAVLADRGLAVAPVAPSSEAAP